ncbi:IS701 family transposase [Streptomyces sp. NBC_01549]|uniref:IS701 family transposase n=1 Tax=Streptomyces sp. NBC_01549 TaxID=2975874 RepID=UPI00225C351A|nr:IS701 family transposase [Streptomyces sp. NBC_01549]MCX4598352.1 IS701 family transposase [Streptomyces sp. NBC_01549]
MTKNQEAVAAQATVVHAGWDGLFEGLMGRFASCFPRRETRLTCRNMVSGLLMVKESANCWSLAEAIGHSGPHVLQHFLSRARFDTEAVRRSVAAWTVEQLGEREVMLVVDETGDEKSSLDAVGAARQYSGALGGIGLCQVAVHLSYVSAEGHALVDRRLYLGEAWAADDERRELVGVPDERVFATKPQLAGDMLEDAHASGVHTAWVAADEVYGGRELRARIRALGYGYAIAVPTSHRVTTPGAGKKKVTALLERVPKRAWMRLRTGHGTKAERLYDWAMIDVNPDDAPPGQAAGHSQVLVRRHRRTGTLPSTGPGTPTRSRYRCWSARSAAGGGSRRTSRSQGLAHLDTGQVTCWTSWHRWSLMSMIAYALLAVGALHERQRAHPANSDDELAMVPVSPRELLALLRVFALPRPRQDTDPAHALHWSNWRRRHQHRATACHRRWNNVTAVAIA